MKQLAFVFALLGLVVGCGDKAEDDIGKSPTDVRAAAGKMDTAELEAMIDQCKELLAEKQGELKEILKDKPLSIAGDAGKDLTEAVSKLQRNLQIYSEELQKKQKG